MASSKLSVKIIGFTLVLALVAAACSAPKLDTLAARTCSQLEDAIVLIAGVIVSEAISEAEETGFTGAGLGDAMRDECPELMSALEGTGNQSDAGEIIRVIEDATQAARVSAVQHSIETSGSCTADGHEGTLENPFGEKIDVTLEIRFTNDGVLVETSTDYVKGVRPGEKAAWDGYAFGADFTHCAVEVTDVRIDD